MEKEQDFLSNLPKESAGLILVAFGVLMFVGAYRRWKWVLDMTGQRNSGFLAFMGNWFGENGIRIGMMILSALVIVCGVVLFVLM